MKKTIELWTIKDLMNNHRQILFPEYQREPNLWPLVEKQRLIDSIAREFDIASLYFYEHDDGALDCVDGRQRIGSILCFLGLSDGVQHNNFRLRLINEISNEGDSHGYENLDGKTFNEIDEAQSTSEIAADFLNSLMNYELVVVKLSDSRPGTEFNLQFTRLNLGTIINAGEKLHAMIGEMRDECFEDGQLGAHNFLSSTNIPTRRYAREQVAAQILLQIFSLTATGEFTRARHFDLQRFFRTRIQITDEERELIRRVKELLDLLEEPFSQLEVLRNRAIVVSTVLLAWQERITEREQADELAKFITEFQIRLKWQVNLGLDSATEYRYLLNFQRHLTQASAEKPAFTHRADVLSEQYRIWRRNEELTGDREWQERTGRDPRVVARSELGLA